MTAVILAGGLGTRLREVVPDIPKPMAPVNGRPFLEYLVFWLKKWDIRDLILCVGYKKEYIVDYFNDGSDWGIKIDYSIEDSLLGTGGALKKALSKIKCSEVLVLNGDSFCDLDLKEMLNFHNSKSALITIAVAKTKDSTRYGMVVLDGNNLIIEFSTTPKNQKDINDTSLINAGIYILDSRIYDFIPDGYVSLEKEVFVNLIGKKVYGFLANGFFIDIGIPSDYIAFNNYMKTNKLHQYIY